MSDTLLTTYSSAPLNFLPLRVRGPGATHYLARLAARKTQLGRAVYIKCAKAEEFASFRALSQLANGPDSGPEKKILPPPVEAKRHPAYYDSGTAFGGFGFAATVGIYLKYAEHPAGRLLSPYISSDSFEFTPAEYVDLAHHLAQVARRAGRAPAAADQLDDLNTGFFRHQDVLESRRTISTLLSRFLKEATQLHRAYLHALHTHARGTWFAAREALVERHRQATELWDALRADSFTATTEQFRKRFVAYNGQFSPGTAPLPMNLAPAALAQLLEEELITIGQQLRTLPSTLRAAAGRLTGGNDDHLRQLTRRLDDLLRDVDESGLYQLPISTGRQEVLPKQLDILEGLLARLRNTQRHLPQLPEYFEWRKFWYAQPPRLRRLTGPLLGHPAEDWLPAFHTWYFDRCLENHLAEPTLPQPLPSAEKQRPGRLLHLHAEHQPELSDVLIVLDQTTGIRQPHVVARRSRLDDDTSEHIRIAGEPEPGLFFSQPFHLAIAPDWAEITVGEPINRLRAEQQGERLHLHLPDRIDEQDAAALFDLAVHDYRLLSRLRVHHHWPEDSITSALLTDGFTPGFLVALLIRACQAAALTPHDEAGLTALNAELCKRLGVPHPEPHPLAEEIAQRLRRGLPRHTTNTHVRWRDTWLPILVTNPGTGGKTVVVPDGKLEGGADAGAKWMGEEPGSVGCEMQNERLAHLRTAGFRVLTPAAHAYWRDADAAMELLIKDLLWAE